MSVCKYNLRCNRAVSGKISNKDFIYDKKISQLSKETENKRPRVSAPRVPRPRGSACMTKSCSVALEKKEDDEDDDNDDDDDDDDDDDEPQTPREVRVLHFKCNFCNEPIATLFSLSTHVKSHQKEYCKICYWVVQDDEDMAEHHNKNHNNKKLKTSSE